MLIISRKVREELVLTLDNGEEVRIVVSKIKGRAVSLGVVASKNVKVNRFDEVKKVAEELLKLKETKKIRCDDNSFINTWMDLDIPILGGSVRQILRKEPLRLPEVVSCLKKEFDASFKL